MKPTMKNIVTTYLKAIAFVKKSQDPCCSPQLVGNDTGVGIIRDGYSSYRLISDPGAELLRQ